MVNIFNGSWSRPTGNEGLLPQGGTPLLSVRAERGKMTFRSDACSSLHGFNLDGLKYTQNAPHHPSPGAVSASVHVSRLPHFFPERNLSSLTLPADLQLHLYSVCVNTTSSRLLTPVRTRSGGGRPRAQPSRVPLAVPARDGFSFLVANYRQL